MTIKETPKGTFGQNQKQAPWRPYEETWSGEGHRAARAQEGGQVSGGSTPTQTHFNPPQSPPVPSRALNL